MGLVGLVWLQSPPPFDSLQSRRSSLKQRLRDAKRRRAEEELCIQLLRSELAEVTAQEQSMLQRELASIEEIEAHERSAPLESGILDPGVVSAFLSDWDASARDDHSLSTSMSALGYMIRPIKHPGPSRQMSRPCHAR